MSHARDGSVKRDAGDAREALDRAVAEVAQRTGIVLEPDVTTGPGWRVAGVPMGPFPARLRLDDERDVVWHDVVAAEVVPPVGVEAIVADIPYPRPEIRLMVGEARWLVALSYPLALAAVTVDELLGLLGAGALYATALVQGLDGHVGKHWRARLEEHGYDPARGFPHDPRDLLKLGIVRQWPQLDVVGGRLDAADDR